MAAPKGIIIRIPGFPDVTGNHLYGAGRLQMTLVFDKYFPYDNGNGEPIYDEDTGEQLRDPITGGELQ